MLFILICTIIIPPSTGIDVRHLGIGIRGRIFDPAGRETSLLYDGGNVEISCWKISDNEKKEFQLQFLNEKSRSFHYVSLANSNHGKLQYNISINSTAKSKLYQCIGGRVESIAIKILYVLCNPMSVKPRRICSNEGEFCHITSENSPDCKRLKSNGCLLGPSKGMVGGSQRSQVLPKFNVVCGSGRGTRYGLCQSLVDSPDKAVRFLRSNTRSCDLDFLFYICGKDCRSKKEAGWGFVDVAKTFSIKVRLGRKAKGNSTISCDVAFTKNEKIMSHKVSFVVPKQELYKAVVVSEKLKQLPTPTIADIVCDVTSKGEAILRYQTRLLVFSSDKDLHYNGELRAGHNGDQNVSVTAADGLFVCTEKVKKCLATKAVLKPIKIKQLEGKELTAFYIGLFAPSPKDRSVLIYEKILNWTVQQPDTKNDTTGSWWKRVSTVVLFIGIIALAVLVVVIIIAILYVRQKKAKQQQIQGPGKTVSLPSLESSKSESKELDTTWFTKYTGITSSPTTGFPSKAVNTATTLFSDKDDTTFSSKEGGGSTPSHSLTEFCASVKSSINDYETMCPKEQH